MADEALLHVDAHFLRVAQIRIAVAAGARCQESDGVAGVDRQGIELADLKLVRTPGIEDGAEGLGRPGPVNAEGGEAQAVHATGQDGAAVAQEFHGEMLTDTASPCAGTGGIGAHVPVADDDPGLGLDALDRVVAHVGVGDVADIDPVLSFRCAHAAAQGLNHLDVAGVAPVVVFGQGEGGGGAAGRRAHLVGYGL